MNHLEAPPIDARDLDALSDTDFLDLCADALGDAERYVTAARETLAGAVVVDGRARPARLDEHQFAAHGFAWAVSQVAALRALLGWGERRSAATPLAELDRLVLAVGFGEYLAQLAGGIPMSQGEMARPADLGVTHAARALQVGACGELVHAAAGSRLRERIAGLLAGAGHALLPAPDEDETVAMMRELCARFADERVAPHAQAWHRADVLVPDEVVAALGEMGVFGVTIAEAHGGSGLGKLAMCVVSEELSRGYLGVGSLGTRAEIAGELIGVNGSDEQRSRWLPGIATGRLLPTAVFTEPGAGSDLGSLATRARRDGDVYRVTGNKTWITHAARSDLMTLLARTGSTESAHRGLSMFIAEKPRGRDGDPFPAPGMSGGAIPVLGYRGMHEYEIAFDGFEVPVSGLLGGAEGVGFRQLMATFESARVQTAARAVGVARAALEAATAYALERHQFGRPLIGFPRVAAKLGWMVVECVMARELAYAAARAKDAGRRCDVEAGMAKLLGARAAWAAADNAVQIHGGNGYSEETPVSRLLVDARILNIFEGAAEIQAQVIARGVLERRN